MKKSFNVIPCYTDEDSLEGMRQAGNLAARTLEYLSPFVVPGVLTDDLNDLCHAFICDHGAIPAPLNYKGFPKSVCISPNEVVCHGIPGKRRLQDGDIVNIDVTVILNGWYGDTSCMFEVGKVSSLGKNLIQVTKDSLYKAIDKVKPGCRLGDIGHTIQSYVESKGYSVVRDFCGHGIGKVFHGPPEVVHFGTPGTGIQLEEGMFFTIEPMVNAGKHFVRILKDGWTVETCDGSLSAQFEHTVGVTKDGFEIFTK